MSTHHLTGSKQIIVLLNRMGHCISHDEMKSVDASLATEVLLQSEEYDTVLPSNISPGSFIQMGSDNDDFNDETIDGKNTTHVTTMVVYQIKSFGPELKPTVQLSETIVKGAEVSNKISQMFMKSKISLCWEGDQLHRPLWEKSIWNGIMVQQMNFIKQVAWIKSGPW